MVDSTNQAPLGRRWWVTVLGTLWAATRGGPSRALTTRIQYWAPKPGKASNERPVQHQLSRKITLLGEKGQRWKKCWGVERWKPLWDSELLWIQVALLGGWAFRDRPRQHQEKKRKWGRREGICSTRIWRGGITDFGASLEMIPSTLDWRACQGRKEPPTAPERLILRDERNVTQPLVGLLQHKDTAWPNGQCPVSSHETLGDSRGWGGGHVHSPFQLSP